MVKLSPKIPKNLIDLTSSFTTREEFLIIICNTKNVSTWLNLPNKSASTSPIRTLVNKTIDSKKWDEIMFKKHTWQLTLWGAVALSSVYIYYDVQNEISPNIELSGKVLIGMNRILKGPWYPHHSSIRIWNQDAHFELKLLDGDFSRFLDLNTIS